jgi:hypothetical protein
MNYCDTNLLILVRVIKIMALTSPTGGGRSVGIVRSRTKATEFSFLYILHLFFSFLCFSLLTQKQRAIL